MLSFGVINLFVPGDVDAANIRTAAGTWRLKRHLDFERIAEEIRAGKCGETYFIEYSDHDEDAAFDELTPVLLGSSFATGLSVTIKYSTPISRCTILQPTEFWPRDRAMGLGSPVVMSAEEFADLVERFVVSWNGAGATEKARILVHHWLDGLACWSMEDLYLSASTLLQIIAATEADIQGRDLSYFDGVTRAAQRAGIRALSRDFKDMRNELIHGGRLIGGRFAGQDKAACAAVVADVLNWFDEYMHSVLALGSVRKVRFQSLSFHGLNAYSID